MARNDNETRKVKESRKATGARREVAAVVQSGSDRWRMALLRIVAVAAQAATFLVTYKLWQLRVYSAADEHSLPPLLPLLQLPRIDMLPWLMASLVVVLFAPKWGVPLHCVLLVLAMLMDQFRIQPQIVSLAILMVATLPGRWPRLVGRAHLIAAWFFAGFHKVISPGFYDETVPFLLRPLLGSVDQTTSQNMFVAIGAFMALGEMSLALLALWPRTRRVAATAACGMHLSLLVWLSLVVRSSGGVGWNQAVWPWNAALAAAAIALIWPWNSSPVADWLGVGRRARMAIAFILLSPVGYYFGVLDAFLAHCVYSNNTVDAHIELPDGQVFLVSGLAVDLNAGTPPAHRIYEEYFREVGKPGETLVIDDPRWCAKWLGYSHRVIRKRAEGASWESGDESKE